VDGLSSDQYWATWEWLGTHRGGSTWLRLMAMKQSPMAIAAANRCDGVLRRFRGG